MTPSIQAGHAIVANLEFLKPAVQLSEKEIRPADRPSPMALVVSSYAVLMSAFESERELVGLVVVGVAVLAPATCMRMLL
jgi:hypothetical protein